MVIELPDQCYAAHNGREVNIVRMNGAWHLERIGLIAVEAGHDFGSGDQIFVPRIFRACADNN